MVAYPHLSTHSFWNIRWNDLIFCTGAQYALWLHCWKNQDCVQDTVRLNQLEAGHACHMVLKRYNKINHIMNFYNYAWKYAILFICFFLSVLYYFWIPPINWTCRASNSPATYSSVVMVWKKETTNRPHNVNRQYIGFSCFYLMQISPLHSLVIPRFSWEFLFCPISSNRVVVGKKNRTPWPHRCTSARLWMYHWGRRTDVGPNL